MSYQNAYVRQQKRRSKCEIYLCQLIKDEFPNLKIVPNERKILNGYEIDVAIPSLNFGIEWNGKCHYFPIYGEEKLKIIQQRDSEKQEIAKSKNFNLVVVPDLVSNRPFVEKVYIDISKMIKELVDSCGIEPHSAVLQTAAESPD